jgi:P-type conjugative transfer protein TrbJ
MLARLTSRKIVTAPTTVIAIATVVAADLVAPARPAQAIVVFDPSNYSQNVLTAARTLQQINNQIQSLQNQAQSLLNQARNLKTVGFPELGAITQTMQQINQLMGRAQGIQFRVDGLEKQFRELFPTSFNPALTTDQHVVEANKRLSMAMIAFQHTMSVQAQVVQNVESDAPALNSIIGKSQEAAGALQVAQATNQLLALTARQQFQIQQMAAAQYRAQAIEQARQAQAESDAHAATAKFLGSGSAYTAH